MCEKDINSNSKLKRKFDSFEDGENHIIINLHPRDIDKVEETLSHCFEVAPMIYSSMSFRFRFDDPINIESEIGKENCMIDQVSQLGELKKFVKEFLEKNYDYAQIADTEPNQISLTIKRDEQFEQENNKSDDDAISQELNTNPQENNKSDDDAISQELNTNPQENNKSDDDAISQELNTNPQVKHVIINVNDENEDAFDELFESGVSGWLKFIIFYFAILIMFGRFVGLFLSLSFNVSHK
ncbi:327_t:CDS:1 [Ambispora leptoticha]|uniref:327_t:CDS:1 n=1 Tax=Ambispora leptoticha TaxID=144679 RepID=A0A9N9CST7_9GLOM|nr:327_t:CDS:1 [Ambispora leptoticha]